MPYIGNVQVAGKTIESARNTIARQMESIAPSVQVLVSAQPGQNNIARAVDGVSLSVRRGETLAVVGESGCGKSTLARLLLRLIDPTAGEVFYGGRDIARLN